MDKTGRLVVLNTGFPESTWYLRLQKNKERKQRMKITESHINTSAENIMKVKLCLTHSKGNRAVGFKGSCLITSF